MEDEFLSLLRHVSLQNRGASLARGISDDDLTSSTSILHHLSIFQQHNLTCAIGSDYCTGGMYC